MRNTAVRVFLGILAVSSLQLGVWATFWPHQFYTTFPGGGHTWVAVNGPYNEHFVRDFGGLNLTLAVLLIAAVVSMSTAMVRTAAVGYLVFGIPHLVYHLRHLDVFTGTDKAVNAVILSLAVLLALGALLLSLPTSARDPVPAAQPA
ncbi:MAG TPA: hypothetical protein VFA83_03960 [Acidimicrobiales bacterium]|nr:hypothetical protein [Acidimicrobiales bacterium]